VKAPWAALATLLVLSACSGRAEPEVTFNTPQAPASTLSAAEGELPDIVLQPLGRGEPVRLSDISGKPTVINTWATWCAPCRKELPFLGRAAQEYEGRVGFLGVNVADPDTDAALAMVKSTGATFPHVVDLESKTRVPLAYTGGLPSTVFVDAEGRIVGEERTWFRSYAEVTAAIRRHLGVAP
jgi:thiol-disulfide isomerase/thioredoxin